MIKDKINKYSLWIVFFLTFLGFYVIVLSAMNAGMSGATRAWTIPTRFIIGISCVFLFLVNLRNKGANIKWFIWFITIYIARILFDYTTNEYFYIPYSELVLYFVSFSVVPFLALSKLDFTKVNSKKLYYVFLLSALLFGFLASSSYARFIGQIGRLSSSTAGEDVISPLILSYCGTLIVGVVIIYLLYNKTSFIIKLLSFAAIGFSIIPFFLGASRGSIFALFLPFLFIAINNLSPKKMLRYSFLFIVLIFGVSYLDTYLQSGLLNRFFSIGSAIESGSSSAVRLDIWKMSFSQFIDNPVFGDRLNTTNVNHYPHNIILEVLQSVGIMGFIPFIVLIIKGIRSSNQLFKKHTKYAWLSVFFIQSIMQNMFSGALYSAGWLWTSLAIIFAVERSIYSK